jgi:hypothetical protein
VGIGFSAFRGFLYLMLAKKGDGYQWATTNPRAHDASDARRAPYSEGKISA